MFKRLCLYVGWNCYESNWRDVVHTQLEMFIQRKQGRRNMVMFVRSMRCWHQQFWHGTHGLNSFATTCICRNDWHVDALMYSRQPNKCFHFSKWGTLKGREHRSTCSKNNNYFVLINPHHDIHSKHMLWHSVWYILSQSACMILNTFSEILFGNVWYNMFFWQCDLGFYLANSTHPCQHGNQTNLCWELCENDGTPRLASTAGKPSIIWQYTTEIDFSQHK